MLLGMITSTELRKLRKLIADGREAEFYSWQRWKNLRPKVFELDNNECQMCKAKGRFRSGYIVHHVKRLQDRPDLALSIWDPVTKERQLVSVCKWCHEEEHPESLHHMPSGNVPITAERWD